VKESVTCKVGGNGEESEVRWLGDIESIEGTRVLSEDEGPVKDKETLKVRQSESSYLDLEYT
jgi:hypothetical protein